MIICPLCKQALQKEKNSYTCNNKHCFDIAKQGYVNLLPVQNKHSLNPGDNKLMLTARREFLNRGHYDPLLNAVLQQVTAALYSVENPVIADIGCGEGYYLQQIAEQNAPCKGIGIDIAKDAVKMACGRSKDIDWIVATASLLPLKNNSVDLALAVFSLFLEDEFYRVVKPGGYAIEVTAANEHLIELKHIIYDEVFQQDKHPCGVEKFKEVSNNKHTFRITLQQQDLKLLLQMTPHFWRIKEEKAKQIETVGALNLTVAFWLRVLRKEG